jgi:uncharacterized protein
MEEAFDTSVLTDIVKTRMPFGKYKDALISDLPVHYLEWFNRKGFPKGRLGILLATVYEIKLNGLDLILKNLKRL